MGERGYKLPTARPQASHLEHPSNMSAEDVRTDTQPILQPHLPLITPRAVFALAKLPPVEKLTARVDLTQRLKAKTKMSLFNPDAQGNKVHLKRALPVSSSITNYSSQPLDPVSKSTKKAEKSTRSAIATRSATAARTTTPTGSASAARATTPTVSFADEVLSGMSAEEYTGSDAEEVFRSDDELSPSGITSVSTNSSSGGAQRTTRRSRSQTPSPYSVPPPSGTASKLRLKSGKIPQPTGFKKSYSHLKELLVERGWSEATCDEFIVSSIYFMLPRSSANNIVRAL